MLLAIFFLVTFLFGGLTGVLLASPPIDFHVTDSYFVVAHFHYVVFGSAVFGGYAGMYFWFPKMTGRMLDERLGKLHAWTQLIGFHMTFLVQHWLGIKGMPRRIADYSPSDGFTTLNTVSTIGAFLLGASQLVFFYNVIRSYRHGELAKSATIPGVTAIRWNGLRRVRLHGTTSSRSHAFVPNGRRSTCTIRRSRESGFPASPEAEVTAPMKVEGYVFGVFTTFLGGRAIVYWFTSKDPTGTAALGNLGAPGRAHRRLPAGDRAAAWGPVRQTCLMPRSLTAPAIWGTSARAATGRSSSRWAPPSCCSEPSWASGSPSSGLIATFATLMGLMFEHFVNRNPIEE